MRKILAFLLAFGMLIHSVPAAFAAESVTSQITAMPLGSNIEVHLKNKQKVRGAKGVVSNSGFLLVSAGASDRQIAFDDVASVKQVNAKSHTTRNVLIGVAIGVGVLAIAIGVLAAKAGIANY